MKCRDKVVYRTRKLAWEYAYFYAKTIGTLTGVYQCHTCGMFHLSRKAYTNYPHTLNKKKIDARIAWLKKPPLIRKIIHWYKSFILNRRKMRRIRQRVKEFYEKTHSRIRRKIKGLQPKRKFKDETLPYDEMKIALSKLRK